MATLNDTWGYNKDDENWKSPEDIIKQLVKIINRGGNYLLNIGPKANGTIPKKSIEILNCAIHIKKATLLRDGRELEFKVSTVCEGDTMVEVEIPEDLRAVKNYCVCLEIEEKSPVFEPLRG